MISTGIKKLDNYLGGGIKGGIITDIFGATGTGKTFVAFQIVWKLWNSRWNKTGQYRKTRVLHK